MLCKKDPIMKYKNYKRRIGTTVINSWPQTKYTLTQPRGQKLRPCGKSTTMQCLRNTCWILGVATGLNRGWDKWVSRSVFVSWYKYQNTAPPAHNWQNYNCTSWDDCIRHKIANEPCRSCNCDHPVIAILSLSWPGSWERCPSPDRSCKPSIYSQGSPIMNFVHRYHQNVDRV